MSATAYPECARCAQDPGEGPVCQWCGLVAETTTLGGYGSPAPRHTTGKPIPTQRHRPLTKTQKAKLAITAKQAWSGLVAAGALDGEEERDCSAWRHRIQMEECAMPSLTEATQAHYLGLLAAFTRYLPGEQAQCQSAAHAAAAGPAKGEHDLAHTAFLAARRECEGPGLSPGFILTIARRKTGHAIPNVEDIPRHCTARELWQLAYTLKNRAAAKRDGPSQSRNKSQRRSDSDQDSDHKNGGEQP